MNNAFKLLLPAMLLVGSAAAQITPGMNKKYAQTITAEELQEHLEVLASDEYEGRETGHNGQKMAAAYISAYFKSLGLPELDGGGYEQQFDLEMLYPNGAAVSINGKEYQFLKDFYYFRGFSDTMLNVSEIQFLGYGIEDENYNDYKDTKVAGKVLMVLDGEPTDKKGNSLISGTKSESKWGKNWRTKGQQATNKKAAALLIVVDDMNGKLAKVKNWASKPSMRLKKEEGEDADFGKARSIPRFYISREMAYEILKNSDQKLDKVWKQIDKKGKPVQFTASTEMVIDVKRKKEDLQSSNVLGYIEGTEFPDELIVVTAHYDHLGKDGEDVYNGADDDGSGTVCALEIAEAFVQAKRDGHGPRRSILIMTVSGEEKGLLGSEYYSEHPIYPLENTVANLNIDMVGRTDENHDHPNYVYLIGSDKLSRDLHEISEKANERFTKLELDYTYNDENDPNRYYYRSDHYNFAKKGIPVIFYFSGVHEDYHKPTDTVDKIMFDKTATIAQLVFHTAWALANRDKRIDVDADVNME